MRALDEDDVDEDVAVTKAAQEREELPTRICMLVIV
jgi:hypothetical protein